jgi:regulator of sigma E protease
MESIVEILSYIFWVILAITILVFVHEMGHFLFAKLFKMRVDRFSVGFPPKLFAKQIGETEYVIGATPLGGYVKIAGMIDESMDTDFVNTDPEPWEFRAKPVWQRVIVIAAGVVFNVLLAFVIFTGLKMAYGDTYIPAENVSGIYVEEGSIAHQIGLRTGDRLIAVSGKKIVDFRDHSSVESLISDPLTLTAERNGELVTLQGPEDIFTQLNRADGNLGIGYEPSIIGRVIGGSPADSVGIQPGDRITAIGGKPVRFWEEMTGKIQMSEGAPILVQWQRPDSLASDDGSRIAQVVEHISNATVYEAAVKPVPEDGRYMLGVGGPTYEILAEEFGFEQRRYSPIQAVAVGLEETWVNTSAIAISLTRVFTGQENFRENVGGPIMIAQVTKQAADMGARFFWNIVAILSITLAIINILPIPVLDGGHLVFLLYEGITRREPSIRFRMITQQVGMLLLLAFMTFVIFNDILRL